VLVAVLRELHGAPLAQVPERLPKPWVVRLTPSSGTTPRLRNRSMNAWNRARSIPGVTSSMRQT
jgi:hypothetical protein